MFSRLTRLRESLNTDGVSRTLLRVGTRVRTSLFPWRLRDPEAVRAAVRGKRGLEIGGPSPAFRARGQVPIYESVGALDGCNFGEETMWEGKLVEGQTFLFDPAKPRGKQYIAEASDLAVIPSSSYDFVLSCHSIEHCANPLKAIKEWQRVIRADGVVVLVVPHRDATFDRRRGVTTIEHIIEDYERGVGEDDLTHLSEWCALLDYERANIVDRVDFARRAKENLRHRGIHHHVFDTALVVKLCDSAGLQVELVETVLPDNIVVVARKGGTPDNTAFLAPSANFRRHSHFPTDRR